MSRRHESPPDRRRLTPDTTVADLTDSYIEEFDLPELPHNLPHRYAEALGRRVEALLFHLEQGRHRRYLPALEVRLARDAHRAVLTAYELGLEDAERWYTRFRQVMESLGWERTDVGFCRPAEIESIYE